MSGARFCVLISGGGRNLQALMDACADGRIDGSIVSVISNRDGVQGLTRAERAGIPARVIPHTAFGSREDFDAELGRALTEIDADFVLLAGFMRILGAPLIEAQAGRMLNIHPSLLPKYRGLHTHRRVLEAGDREHGASVHFVTAELDGGPVAVQGQFTVRAEDDETSLTDRVMHEIERHIYPQAAAWLATGDLSLRGGVPFFRGQPLHAPLGPAQFDAAFRTDAA